MKSPLIILLLLPCLIFAIPVPASGVDGKKIYKRYCARCHGEDGSVTDYGKKIKPRPARDLRTNRLLIRPKELPVIIKYGIYGREMPNWENVLGEEEIFAVADYVRTLKYSPNVKQGEMLFNEMCFPCHGKEGPARKIFKAPDLDTSPLPAFEIARLIRFGSHGSIMVPKEESLTNPMIADIVEYIESIRK